MLRNSLLQLLSPSLQSLTQPLVKVLLQQAPESAAAAESSQQSSCLTFFSSLSTPLNRALGECCFLGLLAVGPFNGFFRLPFDGLPGLAMLPLAAMSSSSTLPSVPLCHRSPQINRCLSAALPVPDLGNMTSFGGGAACMQKCYTMLFQQHNVTRELYIAGGGGAFGGGSGGFGASVPAFGALASSGGFGAPASSSAPAFGGFGSTGGALSPGAFGASTGNCRCLSMLLRSSIAVDEAYWLSCLAGSAFGGGLAGFGSQPAAGSAPTFGASG